MQPAVAFLDDLIKWHVDEWAWRWSGIRAKIKPHLAELSPHDPVLDDHHSLEAFCKLADVICPGNADVTDLRNILKSEPSRAAS